MWATHDADFAQAQCRIYNDWAWETFSKYNDRMSPLAAIATADLPGRMRNRTRRETRLSRPDPAMQADLRCARSAPSKLQSAIFDPLWAVIQETGLPITFHVSTGRDPRAARKDGGAVINYVSHSLVPTIEPVANLCGSGVLERFPGIKFAAIESGIGWVRGLWERWTRPIASITCGRCRDSRCCRASIFAQRRGAFQEDPVGLDLAMKYNLTDNFLWANDYPHHEGSWPHSAEAIERQMGHLPEERARKSSGSTPRGCSSSTWMADRRRLAAAATETAARCPSLNFRITTPTSKACGSITSRQGRAARRSAPWMAADLVRMASCDAAARRQVLACRA